MICHCEEDVRVRQLRAEDIEALRDMYLEEEEICMKIPSRYVDIWLKCMTEGYSVVAEVDGKLVGHAVVNPVGDGDVSLCIYVRRGYRSMGIGTALVKSLIDFCRRMGYRGIRVVTEKDNVRAINFFRKLGFRFLRAGYGYEMYLPIRSDRTSDLPP